MNVKIFTAGIIVLVAGIASSIYFSNQSAQTYTQLTNYRSQATEQERGIQLLDAEINAYWTAIQKANAANGILLPDSPEAYSQNLLPAATGLESVVNAGLSGAIEAKAESTRQLSELNRQIQQGTANYEAENIKMLGGIVMMFIGMPLAVYGLSRPVNKEKYEKKLIPSPV